MELIDFYSKVRLQNEIVNFGDQAHARNDKFSFDFGTLEVSGSALVLCRCQEEASRAKKTQSMCIDVQCGDKGTQEGHLLPLSATLSVLKIDTSK